MTEDRLVCLVYLAALFGQKLQRNWLVTQKRSWQEDLKAVREWLADRSLTL